MMVDAESPRAPFELLYTHCDIPPATIVYDNGCNLDHYILNREPHHFRDMDVLVDSFHYSGHKNCSSNYKSTGYPFTVRNASMAEQKNTFFADMKNLFAYMDQVSALFFVRFKLYRMNRLQRRGAFWRP